MLGGNTGALGGRGHRGDTASTQQDGSPSVSSKPSEDSGLPLEPITPHRCLHNLLCPRSLAIPKLHPKPPSPHSLPLPLPSSSSDKVPHVSQEDFCPGQTHHPTAGTFPQLHTGGSLVLTAAAGWGQDTQGLAIHISSLLLGRRGAGGSHLILGGSAPASPQPLTREEPPLSGQQQALLSLSVRCPLRNLHLIP